MVIQLVRYNVRPDKAAEFATWVQAAIPILLSAPGIVEIQGYRNITGTTQVTTLYVFNDLAGFAMFRSNDAVDKVTTEAWQYIENTHTELLGPSTFAPEPLRPQR